MTRLTFPDEGSRSAQYVDAAGRVYGAINGTALVYTDAGATTLADLRDGSGSALSVASTLTLDTYGRLPIFQGPNDGTDTLYVKVNSGPVTAVYARSDDRLDLITSTGAANAAAIAAEATARAAADALLAPLASPALTGNPTAPTQTAGNSSTRVATTAFTTGAIATQAAADAGSYVPKVALDVAGGESPVGSKSWRGPGSSGKVLVQFDSSNLEGHTLQFVDVDTSTFMFQFHVETGTISQQGSGDNTDTLSGRSLYHELLGPRPYTYYHGSESGAHPYAVGERNGYFIIAGGDPAPPSGSEANVKFQWDMTAAVATILAGNRWRWMDAGGTVENVSLDGSNGDVIAVHFYDKSGTAGAANQYPSASAVKAARGATQYLGTSSLALDATSTSWTNLNTGTDIALSGVTAGDWIEVGVSGLWTSVAETAFLDVTSVVSAAPVNYWSGSGGGGASSQGVMAWRGSNYSNLTVIGGSVMRQVTSGDLSSGVLTMRLRTRSAGGATRSLFNTANNPFHFWAKNLGQ